MQRVEALLSQAKLAEQQQDLILANEHYQGAARELLSLSQTSDDAGQAAAYAAQATEYFNFSSLLQQRIQAKQKQEIKSEQTHQERQHQYVPPVHQVPSSASPPSSETRHVVYSVTPEESAEVPTLGSEVSEEFSEKEIKRGAIVAGGAAGSIAGSIIGLPIIGGVAGAMYASHVIDDDSRAGQRARDLGLFGAKVIRKLCAFNRKHKVSERVQSASAKAFNQINQKLATKPESTYVAPAVNSCPCSNMDKTAKLVQA